MQVKKIFYGFFTHKAPCPLALFWFIGRRSNMAVSDARLMVATFRLIMFLRVANMRFDRRKIYQKCDSVTSSQNDPTLIN